MIELFIASLIVGLIGIGIAWLRAMGRKWQIDLKGDISGEDRIIKQHDIFLRVHRIIKSIIRQMERVPSLISLDETHVNATEQQLLKHYGLQPFRVRRQWGKTGGAPAYIQQVGSEYTITINPAYEFDPVALRAILAHECAHIWVDQHLPENNHLYSLERNVDVATILLGAGLLVLKSVRQSSMVYRTGNGFGVDTQTLRFGYLTLAEQGAIFVIYLRLCGLNIRKVKKQLPSISRLAMKIGESYLPRNPIIIRAVKSHYICKCSQCFQDFRLPVIAKKSLLVRCPLCKESFEFRGKTMFRSAGFSPVPSRKGSGTC